MKRILIVSEHIPYPLHINGEVSTLYNLIKSDYMSQFSIDLLYFENEKSPYEDVFSNDINKFIRIPSIKREVVSIINEKLIIKPYGVWRVSSRKFNYFDASQYDVIIFGSMVEASVIERVRNTRAYIIIFAADSPVLYYSTKKEIDRRAYKRIYNWLQKKLCIKYEKTLSLKADRIAYVSEKDSNIVRQYIKNTDIKTARIGVKTSNEKIGHNKNGIVQIGFSGVMTYVPNHRAVDYIINEIVPLLEKKNIVYKVHIIGKDPDPQWARYSKNDDIIITGFLDNIDEYISGMDIYISPLFEGSGMKNKILQALSIGVPLIASQISVDGIDGLKDGNNYILCDENPENWANRIEELYDDLEKRVKLSKFGKELIEEEYSWNRFAKDLIE